jgi:hypothetical protein
LPQTIVFMGFFGFSTAFAGPVWIGSGTCRAEMSK